MYQEIFKQGKIGNITLKNRLVMSPMGTSLAEMDGSPSEDMIQKTDISKVLQSLQKQYINMGQRYSSSCITLDVKQ